MAVAIDNSLLEAVKINEEKNLYSKLKEHCEILQQIKLCRGENIDIVASSYALEKEKSG